MAERYLIFDADGTWCNRIHNQMICCTHGQLFTEYNTFRHWKTTWLMNVSPALCFVLYFFYFFYFTFSPLLLCFYSTISVLNFIFPVVYSTLSVIYQLIRMLLDHLSGEYLPLIVFCTLPFPLMTGRNVTDNNENPIYQIPDLSITLSFEHPGKLGFGFGLL